jgi:hypothetical protein
MITRKEIEKFLEHRKIAIAGVSRNPRKFGHQVYKELKKKGYELYPVNPLADNIEGDKCFTSIMDLPSDVNHLLILTPKPETDNVLREAISRGMKNIWVQQMSETKDTLKLAEEYQIELIHKKCIFMFAEPVTGVHKFHHTLMKWLGRLPK